MAAAAIVATASPDAGVVLVFEHTAVLRGEVWRLWTAHLVHFGWNHLVWNLAVFLPAGVWLERGSPVRVRALLIAAPPTITLALLATDLARYGGLSGVATGLLVLLALTKLSARKGDAVFWWALLLLVAAKIAMESVGRQSLLVQFDPPGIRSVPLAHFVGAAAGMAVFTLADWKNRTKASADSQQQ